jgi:hypothetical protein
MSDNKHHCTKCEPHEIFSTVFGSCKAASVYSDGSFIVRHKNGTSIEFTPSQVKTICHFMHRVVEPRGI